MPPTESKMIENGHRPVTAIYLYKQIIEKPIQGEYLGGFRFISYLSTDGSMEGINHVGSHNRGTWSIDSTLDTLSVQWDNGWVQTTTRAYHVDNALFFYDIDSGLWRNTLRVLNTSFKREHLSSGEWRVE